LLVQPLEGAGRIVFRAYLMKLNARGTHPRLGIRNPEDHYLVASQLQGTRQRGHWIQMTGPRKTKCSQSRHG
jgi:hypothetical protein